jgi:Fic family protein
VFCGEAVHRDRSAYIDGLKQARRSADWTWWTKLLLGFVERSAQANLRRLELLTQALDGWRQDTKRYRADSAIHPLLGICLGNPKLTVTDAVRDLETSHSYQAVNNAIAELERLGILRQTGPRGRHRLYEAADIMRIFELPDMAAG